MSRVVTYSDSCVELHLDNGAVVQVNVIYAKDETGVRYGAEEGFGIRVWQPLGSMSGTPEDQQNDPGKAHNCTNLSAHIGFDEAGAPKLENLDYRGEDYVTYFAKADAERQARENTAEAKRQRKQEEADRLEERAAKLREELT